MQRLDGQWNQSVLIQANPNDSIKQWIEPHSTEVDYWLVGGDQPNHPLG